MNKSKRVADHPGIQRILGKRNIRRLLREETLFDKIIIFFQSRYRRRYGELDE
jgi:hypothetical protein